MSYPTINLKLDLLIKQFRAGLRAETEAERLQAEETFKRAVGELYADKKPQICDRNYGDGIIYSARLIDGVPYCTSCEQPTSEHRHV